VTVELVSTAPVTAADRCGRPVPRVKAGLLLALVHL